MAQRLQNKVSPTPQSEAPTGLHAWRVPAYADFDPQRLTPSTLELEWSEQDPGAPVYQEETDQVAVVIANLTDQPVTVRVEPGELKDEAGNTAAISFVAREVVGVEASNGEVVQDALPELAARLLHVPPRRAAKLWLSFTARGIPPGMYAGNIKLKPLRAALPELSCPFRIHVSALALPDSALALCTWDYMPNQWFPQDPPAAALGDMHAHGVNVFPRTTVPKATYARGELKVDCAPVEQELKRLDYRDKILWQIGMPQIAGAERLDAGTLRQLQLDYLRQFRDFLQIQGLHYEDYAFYPVDEPGLDYGPRVPVFLEAARLFREADPKIQIYTDPVPALSLKDYLSIEPYVDVWCPNMRMVTGLLAKDLRIEHILSSGKPVWSYECIAQVKSMSPLRYNRGNAWRAWYFGLDGIGHWTYSTTPLNLWYSSGKNIEEYALVYPGEAPVPSVRWEAVRDGLEDIAAVRLLEQRQHEHPRPETEQLLRRLRTDSMECVDDAFIESRDYLKQGDRRVWHTWWDAVMFEEIRKAVEAATLVE